MNGSRDGGWSRRRFVAGLAVAGASGVLGLRVSPAAAEPPPETTTLRLVDSVPGTLCFAPQYVAEELLRAEGFTDVRYVRMTGDSTGNVAADRADLSLGLGVRQIIRVDAGDPVLILAGGHVGCYELFGGKPVRTLRDLRARTIAVPALGSGPHVFLSAMLAYIGLDPRKDVRWAVQPFAEVKAGLANGTVDAFLGFPPEPQELRAAGIGRVVVNTSLDRPWSHYFCSMVAGSQTFVRAHPVATKRALRAILKGADLCATTPDRAARVLVDGGRASSYELALATMKDIPYGKWRAYNPEDTVRFYGLRLRDAGIVRSSPERLIAQGTDWRFLNELKRELKG